MSISGTQTTYTSACFGPDGQQQKASLCNTEHTYWTYISTVICLYRVCVVWCLLILYSDLWTVVNTVVWLLQLMASDMSVIFRTKKSRNAHTDIEEGDNSLPMPTKYLYSKRKLSEL